MVEENSFEAVSNNIFGTLNCALAAIDSEVETFVLISTDKAVRPTNIMGATKRFAELILQSLSVENGEKEGLKMEAKIDQANWILMRIKGSLEKIRDAQDPHEAQFCRKESVFDTSDWDEVAREEEVWE